MILIDKIQICEFRGIRDLTLTMTGQNFAACGPNGTGKSGIVDAIEFALTGDISRLKGAGTGGLSVKQHGPHVDSRNKPEQASVTMDVIIPSLGNRRATIHRTVKAADKPVITPAGDAQVKGIFDGIALHPEFVLSRRELIRYVLSEPGARAKEVQALLRLEELEKLRAVLTKIKNAVAKEVPVYEKEKADGVANFLRALGISDTTPASVLAVVNPAREILGLAKITEVSPTISLRDGLSTTSAAPARIPKVQARETLELHKTAIGELQSTTFKALCVAAIGAASELGADGEKLDGVEREAILKKALTLYDGEKCPVCDTPFTPEQFRSHVQEKLDRFDAISKKRADLDEKITPILEAIVAAGTAVKDVIELAARFDPIIDVGSLVAYKAELLVHYQKIKAVVPLGDCVSALTAIQHVPDLSGAVMAMTTAIEALPEPTKQDAARDLLTIAQERLEQIRRAKANLIAAKLRTARAENALKVFGDVSTKELEGIYKQVENDFADYYRIINKDDESTFTASLIPSLGRLGFDVDFYGRGRFPPGAYHSEGHQDGMGLCLYLALMNHLLGAQFCFAVLDDVLMSVDSGHRREVCTLLKSKFPHVQFFFTTHDEIWLKHMKSEALIRGGNFAHFRKWSVDLGPTEWSDRDVWKEIDDQLSKNDVRAAAALLRHFLEHFAKEACGRLRAKVEFRGDAQFMLGDLMPNAIAAMGETFRKAKAAANSWNQTDVVSAITADEAKFDAAKSKTNVDQWQVNSAVHYNEWANFQKADFQPVVDAFKMLTAEFACPSCEAMYSVTPERGPKENLRCGCGTRTYNLKAKP